MLENCRRHFAIRVWACSLTLKHWLRQKTFHPYIVLVRDKLWTRERVGTERETGMVEKWSGGKRRI